MSRGVSVGRRPTSVRDVERIRRLRFFRDLAPTEIRLLLSRGEVRRVAAGEFLATEGTRKQRRVLYVVLRGGLEYVRRVRGAQAAVLLRLSPGDVGGFLTFFSDEPSPVSVRSAEPSLVFEIGRREFQGMMEEWPVLAAKALFALLGATVAHLDALLDGQVAVAAWTLDMAHQLRQLPLMRDAQAR